MPSFLFAFRGEWAALSAALIWAIASVIYIGIGRQLSPLLLNLLKGLMAIAFLLLTLLVQGKFLPQMNAQAMGLLLLSGAIGIGLGDTAYFEALNCLGARRALVLESLSPPLTALLALTFLQERLPTLSWLGILLTIAGVTWVIVERTPETTDRSASVHPLSSSLPFGLSINRRGILCGVLAAIGQASGAVLSRAALAGTAIDPLWSTLLRLGAGVLVLILWATLQRYSLQALKPLRSGRFLAVLAGTALDRKST